MKYADDTKHLVCKQNGFGLITAVFLLVVLMALGAAMANLSVMQSNGIAADVQGVRAYQAARAGIEWGLHRTVVSANCPAETSFLLQAATLRSFTVTVSCSASAPVGMPPLTVLQLTSVACNEPVGGKCTKNQGGSAEYVERVLQATLER